MSYPVDLLLYVRMFIIPIFGIVTFIWHGHVFDLGLFRVNFGVRRNRAIFHPTENIHGPAGSVAPTASSSSPRRAN